MTKSLRTTAIALALATAFLSAPAFAQNATKDPHAAHGMMTKDGPMMMRGNPNSEAAQAFAAANMKMHKDMTMDFTGDADVDFVRGMIPHHQGAIDMAQVVLKYGKDPDVRKLAEGIIAAQNNEIAFMTNWLSKHTKQ